MNDTSEAIGHHNCVEMKHDGITYYVISGIWHQEHPVTRILTEMHDEWIHIDARTRYNKYLKENGLINPLDYKSYNNAIRRKLNMRQSIEKAISFLIIFGTTIILITTAIIILMVLFGS